MKPVSLIIPNWNGEDLLRSNLPSIIDAQKNYKLPAEIIVVDDASMDGSVNLLRREFQGVKLVFHKQNRGFGKACWSGALTAKHPILIFLNSDVKVEPTFIAPLANCFEDPTIFAASPLIFDEEGEINQATISIPYFRRGKIRFRPFPVELLLKNTSKMPNPWYTLFPIGAAFAVLRSRFLKISGFDDLFSPFYYEDTDLGFRAWRRGWKCKVVPESHVVHQHVGTIARSFKKFKVSALRKRNRLFFIWKNLTSTRLLWEHIFFQGMRLCYRPFCLDGMVYVATILAIPGFIKAMRRRRMEKKYALYNERKIFRMINLACEKNRQTLESSLPAGENYKEPFS